MQERPGVVTFRSSPLTLLGPALKVGDAAPDFRVVNTDLQTITLKDFAGKVKVIASVPSLDTPVCSTETQTWNRLVTQMGDATVVLVISMDLPFAQKRWCGTHGVDRVVTLSDYRDRSFGVNYGVLIKELGLLARAVFVIDEEDVIHHVQIVPEIAQEPDYDKVMEVLQEIET